MKKAAQETAADLSHQIRNRLTYIMLSSYTLRFDLQKVLSDEHRAEFRKINVAAEEIRAILETLVHTQVAEPRLKNEEIALLIGG